MRNILRLFLSTEGINPWTVLTCLVLASVVEGLGFVTLVPLLMVATNTEPAEGSGLLDGVRRVTFDNTMVFWYYAVLQALAGLALVHSFPRLAG